MTIRTSYSVVFLCCFLASLARVSLAENQSTPAVDPNNQQEFKVKVVVATGNSQAPYSVKAGGGILNEVFDAVFAGSPYRYQMKYLNNADALQQFNEKLVDGITMVLPSMVNGYLSKSYVVFQNSAIFLRDKGYKIDQIQDLANHRVLAFSNANLYLGPEFSAMAAANPQYETMADQMEQIRALFEGRTEIIIADRVIYQFYLKKLIYSSKLDRRYGQEVVLRDIFPPNFYHAAFQDEAIRDAFNAGYERIEKNGKLVDIYRKYTELMIKY